MNNPDESKTRELLESLHCEGVPNWTTKQQQEACDQLRRLYFHWFRKEI